MACRQIRFTRDALKFYVGAFCLMPDHLHLLVSPDRSGLPLGEMMGRYKGHTTNASWQLGWNGKLWKPRFHDRIVRVSEGIAPVAKYIYENPERKGIDSSWP
jgi:REP element-mobilizing transposase RayT